MITLPRGRRIAARAVGSAAVLCWSAWLVAGGMDYTSILSLWVSVVTAVYVAVNAVAVAILFADERAGGEVLLICGALFAVTSYTFASGSPLVAAAVSGGPFVVAGALAVTASTPKARTHDLLRSR